MRLYVEVASTKRVPLIEGSTFQFSVDGIPSTATLRFYSTSPTDYSLHDLVVVVNTTPDPDEFYFYGYVIAISASRAGRMAPGDYLVEARCASVAWLLDYPPSLITKAYQATDDQDIIIDAISEAGLTSDISATTSTVDTIATALDAAYRERTPREVLDDMVQASAGVWYVDIGLLHYNEDGTAGSAAWDINQDSPNFSTTYPVKALSIERHWEQPITDVVILGAFNTAGQQIRAEAAIGGSPPRRFKRVIESELIVSQEMADAVAAAVIATRGVEQISCSFTFTDHDRLPLKANTVLSVTASDHGLSSSTMLLRTVSTRQKTGDVTEFTCKAGGIQPGAERLLRRIQGPQRRQQQLPFFFLGYDFVSSSSESVTVPDASHLQDLTNLTVSFWVIPDSVTGTRTLVRKSTTYSGVPAGAAWVIDLNGAQLRARRVDSGGSIVTAFYNSLAVDTLYHVAVTFTGTSAVQIYVNGSAVGTTGSGGSGINTDVGIDVEIAHNITADAAGDSSQIFDGFLSDIRLYSAVLGTQAIRELAVKPNKSSSVWAGDLVLQLRLDEYGDGEVVSGAGAVRDSSTFANHGTPANTPTGREQLWQ